MSVLKTEVSDVNRGRFQVAAQTERLLERLRNTGVGETIPYTELSELIDMNVQESARCYLASARRIAIRDGILFETVRKVGVKRRGPKGWADHAEHSRVSIRRASGRSLRKSLHMPQEEYEGLDAAQRTRIDLNRTVLAVAHEASKDKSVKKLEPAVQLRSKHLTLSETVKYIAALEAGKKGKK